MCQTQSMGGGTHGETQTDQGPISRSTGMNGAISPLWQNSSMWGLVGRMGCSLVLGQHGKGGWGSDNGQGGMVVSEASPQL